MEELFIRALKGRFRFQHKGIISTEDLFELNENELNDIYIEIKKKLEKNYDSLISTSSHKDEHNMDLLNVVECVFNIKREERIDRENSAKKQLERQRLYRLIEEKNKEELSSLSKEELQERLKAL